MADIMCDSCPRNAIYVLIIQDLVKERDGQKDPVKFFCMEHTVRRVNACLAVPGRYSITIDPTGQHQRTKNTKNKGKVTVRPDDLDKIEAEVNKLT